MVWKAKANLRGPTGRPGRDGTDGQDGVNGNVGDRGPQGLPGAATLPTDTAVAAYITTDGTSATRDALDATYIRTIASVSPTADQASRVNTILKTGSAVGLRKIIRLRGTFSIGSAIVVPSNTELDATEATIILLPNSNGNMLQNAAVTATTTRDKTIAIRGGVWDRGSNGGSGINLHSLMLRRVDGLVIRDLMVKTAAGKYAVNVGDVTAFLIDNIAFATYSDGVHVNGPASNGRISRISGSTGDDSVALTGNDYSAYADVTGSITNVEITDVNTTSTAANNVKVLAGLGCTADDVTVRRVRGAAAQYGVWLGDDNGQTSTKNGTYGSLTVSDVQVAATASGGGAQVYGNLLLGAKRVVISDVTVAGAATNKYGVLLGLGAGGVVDSLLMDRIRVADGLDGRRAATVQGASGSVVNDIELRHLVARGATNMIGLEVKSIAATSVRLIDPDIIAATAGGSDWVQINASSAVARTVVAGGQITGGRDVLSAFSTTTLVLDGGLIIDTIDRVGNFYLGANLIVLGAVRVGTVTNRLFMGNSGATALTFTGGGHAELPSNPGLYQRASTAVALRVNGSSLPAAVQDLSPAPYDQCTLVQAAGVLPVGAKVISNGTIWKDLFTGTTN